MLSGRFSQLLSHFQGDYNSRNVSRGPGDEDEESNDRFCRGRPGGFRPESAPTVLNMSPECSLSGPPSVRAADNGEDYHGHMMHNGEELSGKTLWKIYCLAWRNYFCKLTQPFKAQIKDSK